jgi:predicted DNA-binding protein (MmcQ/YjbR family)
MNIEDIRNYCIAKKHVTEHFPFDETTLVFKIGNKMFLLTDLIDNKTINIKCEPEKAVELREKYSEVKPGYHMNKNHWNTVAIDGSIPDNIIKQWIDDSYNLIVKSLPKKIQQNLL